MFRIYCSGLEAVPEIRADDLLRFGTYGLLGVAGDLVSRL